MNTSITYQKTCLHHWKDISYNKSNQSRKKPKNFWFCCVRTFKHCCQDFRKNVLKYVICVPLKEIFLVTVVPRSGNQCNSFYIMFYVNFCYFEKSLWNSADLLLDIPYLLLTTSVKDPNRRGPIQQFVGLKFLDLVTSEGHIHFTASIILPLFLLHFYVCFAVTFEAPLSNRNLGKYRKRGRYTIL